jgi:hypothetical protein
MIFSRKNWFHIVKKFSTGTVSILAIEKRVGLCLVSSRREYSHIGQNHEPDIGQLADLVKRHRSFTFFVYTPNINHGCPVLQTSPSGSTSLKFTNLLSRLIDQVCSGLVS